MSAAPRVVFIYGEKPSGHSAAAAALRDELLGRLPDAQVSEISLASEVAPVVGPVLSAAYLKMIQMTPRFWNYLYDNRALASALKEIREPLGALHRRKLRKAFDAIQPDLVVCTHALPCAVLETDKADGTLRAPLVAALTDYGVHEYWLSPQVDLYLAPADEVRDDLLARGVAADRVVVTGIPVHPRFREGASTAAARRAFRLVPDRPVVLFEGGSKGLGPIAELIDPVLRELPEAQALVVCGRNRELYAGLKRRYARERRVRVLAFTQRMARCFAAADLLVGKPGGVTAAEASACGLPLLIVEPLPGQEERNCRFLTGRGAAVEVEQPSDVGAAVKMLLRAPQRLDAMGEAGRRAAPLDSAARAVDHLLRLLSRVPAAA